MQWQNLNVGKRFTSDLLHKGVLGGVVMDNKSPDIKVRVKEQGSNENAWEFDSIYQACKSLFIKKEKASSIRRALVWKTIQRGFLSTKSGKKYIFEKILE